MLFERVDGDVFMSPLYDIDGVSESVRRSSSLLPSTSAGIPSVKDLLAGDAEATLSGSEQFDSRENAARRSCSIPPVAPSLDELIGDSAMSTTAAVTDMLEGGRLAVKNPASDSAPGATDTSTCIVEEPPEMDNVGDNIGIGSGLESDEVFVQIDEEARAKGTIYRDHLNVPDGALVPVPSMDERVMNGKIVPHSGIETEVKKSGKLTGVSRIMHQFGKCFGRDDNDVE